MFIKFILVIGCLYTTVNSDKPSISEVRSLIVKVRAEAETVRNSNSELNSEISRLQSDSIRKLSDYNIEKYNLSTEFRAEMDELKTLQANLSDLYQQEQSLSREAGSARISRKKLEIGTKLLEQDVEQLDSRRKNGAEEMCLSLFPTLGQTKITQRSANSSDEDEMIILANELQQEKSKLDEYTIKNEELQMVLKDKKMLSDKALKNLESIISEINGDVTKAKQRVDILKKKCDKKKALIASLRETLKNDFNFVGEKKKTLEKLRSSMVDFKKAIQCYNRLEDEIFHHNY